MAARRRSKPVPASRAKRTKVAIAKAPAPAAAPAPVVKRSVDLGREEELVTWLEWMDRSMSTMQQAIKHAAPNPEPQRAIFRVGLADGRTMQVMQVMSHVARGFCTIAPSRWNEREAICDIITGYMFMGIDESSRPIVLCVPPTQIVSVECVLLPEEVDRIPFGFYKREPGAPRIEEVEEKFVYGTHQPAD
jgi:hypothetical protein